MELIPWEAASRSASREFPNILWNPKVYYRSQQSSTSPYLEPDQSSLCKNHGQYKIWQQ
jgi:hypothetical protein